MSSKNTLQVSLDLVLGNASSTIKNVQGLLDSLNISKLDGQFNKNFSSNMSKQLTTLQTESEKLKTSLETSLNGKVDEKGISSSITKMISLYGQLENEVAKIASLPQVDMEKLIKLNPSLAGEITNIEAKVKELQSTIRQQSKAGLTTALQELSQAGQSFAKGSSPDKHIKELNVELQNGKISIVQYAQSLQELQAKYAVYIETSKKAAQNAGTEWDKSGNIRKNAQAFETLVAAAEKAVKPIEKIQGELNSLEADKAKKLGQAYEEISNKAQGVEQGVKEASQSVKEYGDNATSAAHAQNEFISELDEVKSRVKYFFSLTNSIQLFKNAIRDAFETVKELDAAMTETAVVTDFSVGDMWAALPQYTKLAESLGATTLGAYETMTLYYQQGLKTNEAMQLGTETMKMARIAGMDYATTTNLMTSALRGFNMELNTASAQRVNDVYSELAAITASDTEGIATAMSKTASIANSANMELETTSAFLSQIIETTQEAPETAGTALKTIIARFSEVKKLYNQGSFTGVDGEGEAIEVNKVAAALKTAGINMNKFFSGSVGLDDIFLELAEKWDSLDITQQRYIATQAAGSRQQSRFIAMMSDYDRTMELVNAAYNSGGASAEQFAKTQDSLQSKLNKLSDEWERFTMGLANSTVIKGAVDLLTDLLSTINNLTECFDDGKGITNGILKFTAALGAIKLGKTLLNGGLTGVIGNLSKSFDKMDTSGIAKAGDKAGLTFGGSFATSIGRSLENNPFFGKNSKLGQTGEKLNGWYVEQIKKFNIGNTLKETLGTGSEKDISTLNPYDLSSTLENTYRNATLKKGSVTKALTGNLKKQLAPQIQKGLQDLNSDIFENVKIPYSDELGNKIGDGLAKGISNGKITEGIDNAMMEVQSHIEQSLTQMGAGGEGVSQIAQEATQQIFSGIQVNGEEVANTVGPALTDRFDMIAGGLSNIGALSTTAAIGLGLVANKMRECGNEEGAETLEQMSSVLMMVGVGAQFAGQCMQIFAAGGMAALGSMLPVLLAIAAVIGVIALAIKMVEIANYDSLEDKINQLKEATLSASEAAEEAKTAYEDLGEASSSYKKLKRELDGLTKGTIAYSDKLLEANTAASELIKNHDLSFEVDENGLIIIDENELEAQMKKSLKNSTKALNISLGLEQNEKVAEEQMDRREKDEDINKDIRPTNDRYSLTPQKFNDYVEHKITATRQHDEYTAAADTIEDTNQYQKFISALVEKDLIDQYGVVGDAMDEITQLAKDFYGEDIAATISVIVGENADKMYNYFKNSANIIGVDVAEMELRSEAKEKASLAISDSETIAKDGTKEGVVAALSANTKFYSQVKQQAEEQANDIADDSERLAERYAALYDNLEASGKKIYNKETGEEVKVSEDVMKNVINENILQESIKKAGEEISSIIKQINERQSKKSGVDDTISALAEGDTSIETKFLEKIIAGEDSSDLVANALGISSSQFDQMAKAQNLTSQELRDTYVQQAKAISDAQATMVDNLFYQMNGIFSTDFGDSWAKIDADFNEKKQKFTDSLNSLSMSQKTFFSDAAFSIRKSFGTDTSANFLDSTIGSEVFQKMEETDRKVYAEKIQKAFEDIDFSNPISALTQLNDAERNAVNTLESLGVDFNNLEGARQLNAIGEAAKTVYENIQEMRQSFSGADAFKSLYNSDEWKDIQKEIDEVLEKKTSGNKQLNGSDVKALANDFSSLAAVMEEGKMSATGMAEIINSLGANGSLTLQDLDANLWELISTSHQLENAIDEALDFTANFDPGKDEGQVDDWYKSTLDTVNELWNNGEYGNTQLYNYLNSMFSDFAENVTKEGLKEAERKALDKLNAYQYESFQTSWLDIARDSTGDYSSKMAEKGWKVTANSDDSIDLVSTGKKNTTNDLIDSIQYSYGVTEDMAKMMVTSLKNSDAEFAQMMEKNDFVAGIDKYVNNLRQTIKGQEESIVFSDLQVEKIAATTGQQPIEVWKELAKSVNVSTEGLKTEDEIKKKLSETTGIYVTNLKTAADRQKELNKLFGSNNTGTEEGGEASGFKKGDNWLSSFANGNTIDIGRIKTSLSKMGLNEDQIYETIQEGLEHFNNGGDYNWEISGEELDFDKLKEDVKSTVQEGLDNLDNTKLTNTITNGVVQGFLEAQEIINSKINGQDWTTEDYQHYTKLKGQGANITPSDYAALAGEYKNKFGDDFVNAKIVVDDKGVVRVEQSLEKIKQNIATLGNEDIQVNVEKKSLTELNKLSTTVVTLGNKNVEVYVEEEDGSVTKLYNSVGELVGILDETGKSYEVKISDDGKSRELYDSTGKYLGVLELTNGTWTSHVNNTLTQSDQNKVQRYLDSLGTIPSEITTTIKTVYVETSMRNAELSGYANRSATIRYNSQEYQQEKKKHPNGVWRFTQGTEYGVWMYASGTTRSGVPKTQNALVGEEGPELVETNDGKAHLVGVHGPEISKLKKGDIVHNASDTEHILKGKPTKPLKAYKNGTPNGRTTFSAYSGYSKPNKKYGNSSGSSSSGSSGSSGNSSTSSSDSPYQKAKEAYDKQLSNDVISIDWYINRLKNMKNWVSMTKDEQLELNKAIRDAQYDKAASMLDRGAVTYLDYDKQLRAIYNSYPKKNVEGAYKIQQELRDLWKEYADTSYDLGTYSPEYYLQVLQKFQKSYKQGSKVWRDYQSTIISVKNELLDLKFNSGEIGMWQYIEDLKKLQKQYAATSKQARELSKTIREQKIAYAEASQKHGLWSVDYEIIYLKQNLADMKKGSEEYRDALDQIRELQLSNAQNKYDRGQWSYERYMQFLKDYQAENQFEPSTEQYQEIMSKQTELEIEHINELLDKYNQLNNQLGDIDTGRERAQEIININNELADTHDRLVDIKYALDNQVLTEAQRKAFEEEYNELLVRQVQLLDEAKSKQEEYTDIMKEGLEAQKNLMSDGWGTDDPRKAAQLGLMSVQYAENDRYLAQQQKKTAMNNMLSTMVEPQVTLTQKYVSEVNSKKANGEYADDLAYANALSEAMAKAMMDAPTNILPYARVDETSGMVTINQSALDTLKVTNPEEYRKVSEVITIMQGYSEDWMEGNIAEVEATELLEELTDNQKYIDLINRVADDLKQIDQNAIDELEDQKDSIDDIAEKLSSIIEKVREAVDKIRQERDNENTRQDLADKQQKLAYLRQDSTGNALEIKQLEKELADDSQSYTDTLIDQKINELEEQNEETQDELQELIDLKKEEMERKEKEGTYYEQAQKVVDEFIANDLDDVAANTKDIRDTYLGQIIKEGEKLDTSMSKPEQEKTWTEVKKEAEDAGVSKELHDTAEKANLTKETASEVAKSFGETTKDIAQATGKIASAFVPALDYAINGIADAIKKDKENKSYTDDALKGQETTKPSGAASSSGDKKDNTTTTPAKPSTPAPTPTPSKPATSTTTKPASTQGDGKIQKGDRVTFTEGKYYNDSYGTAPTGWWHRGEKNAVCVTLINTDKNASHPYHISTGSKLGSGDLGWVKKSQLIGYKTGGMVDFTGPAWLDGTRSRPESVLSAADTQNLLNLTDVLGNLRKNTAKGTTQTNISNDINIEVKVDRVDSDIDINKLADTIGDKVKKSIYKDTKGFQNTRLTHR